MIITDPTDYRTSKAVSFSRMKVFDRCPLLYYRWFEEGAAREDEETRAMRMGSAAHCMILEGPRAFSQRYWVKPGTYTNDKGEEKGWNGNSSLCKALEEEQRKAGRTPMTPDEAETLVAMREAVRSNPDAVRLLSVGTPELAIRRPFPSLGLDIQGRLDWWNPDVGVVVDLKTIECLDDLKRDVERRGYYRQLAHYRHLAAEEFACDVRCAIIGVEKSEPNRCAVYFLREDYLAIGDAYNLATLAGIKAAGDAGQWGGNPATEELGPSAEAIWNSEYA